MMDLAHSGLTDLEKTQREADVAKAIANAETFAEEVMEAGKLSAPAVQSWGSDNKPKDSHYERGTTGGRSRSRNNGSRPRQLWS